MIGLVNIVYREWNMMCEWMCWNGGYLCFMHACFTLLCYNAPCKLLSSSFLV
jgi:hypothetical protein